MPMQPVPQIPPQSLPAKRKKKGFSFKDFLSRGMNSTLDSIKDFDMYGQPISLYYEGEDTFKTCPGGFISILLLLIMILYGALKSYGMVKRQHWSLIQQTVVSSFQELNQTYVLESNISIAIQFKERKQNQKKFKVASQKKESKSKQEQKLEEYQAQDYEYKVRQIMPYLRIVRKIYDKNEDTQIELTTSSYNDGSMKLANNSHGKLEMVFNISQATIQGTSHHLDPMQEIVTRYQLSFQQKQFIIDAYNNCTMTEQCAKFVNQTPQEILGGRNLSGYLDGNLDIETLWTFYDNYYTNGLIKEADELEQQLLSKLEEVSEALGDQDGCDEFDDRCYQDIKIEYPTQADELWSLYSMIQYKWSVIEAYDTNKQNYLAYIESLFRGFELELVIYDELEYFRHYNNPEFHYPYQRRKTKLGTISPKIDLTNKNYQYQQKTVTFRQSQVCLEQNPLLLFQEFKSSIEESLETIKNEKDDTFLEDCNSQTFSKLKYLNNVEVTKFYQDDYEWFSLERQILYEVVLELDPFKTISERVTTGVLDFIGDLGGFYQAIDLLVFMIGQFFSSRMFIASIASKLYFRKLTEKEVQNRKPQKIQEVKQRLDSTIAKMVTENDSPRDQTIEDNSFNAEFNEENYEQVKISFKNMLTEPILAVFSCCCKVKPILHEKCNEKYIKELQVTEILSRLRDTHSLITKEQQLRPNYSKDWVINFEDESSEDDTRGQEQIREKLSQYIVEEAKQTERIQKQDISSEKPEEYNTQWEEEQEIIDFENEMKSQQLKNLGSNNN